MEKILIIEDEFSINDILTIALKREGYEVFSALNGDEGLKLFYKHKPKIVLLDLMLPDLSGEDICKEISDFTYVIMITAKNHISHKLKGMELGADDYITKPFDISEIKARIKILLRTIDKKIISENEKGIRIDDEKKLVILDGEVLDLTRKEYEILTFLYRNKGIVFSRDKLLERIWGFDFLGDSRTVDVHIRRLRAKLGDSKNDSVITTVFGMGYVIR